MAKFNCNWFFKLVNTISVKTTVTLELKFIYFVINFALVIGTFITLDICICRLEATGLIDVRTTVEKIRSQRAHSIQMPDQYVFCHHALLEYAVSQNLLQNVDLPGFNDSDSDSE